MSANVYCAEVMPYGQITIVERLREALRTIRAECAADCNYPHEAHRDECGETVRGLALALPGKDGEHG